MSESRSDLDCVLVTNNSNDCRVQHLQLDYVRVRERGLKGGSIVCRFSHGLYPRNCRDLMGGLEGPRIR